MDHQQAFTILRMLTPDEIKQLTENSNGEAFNSLTDLVLKRPQDGVPKGKAKEDGAKAEAKDGTKEGTNEGAKILPFEKPTQKAEEVPDAIDQKYQEFQDRTATAEERQQEARCLAKESHVHFSGTSVAFEEEEIIEEQIETSVFILAEQRKLRKSQKMLKGKEVLQLYQKNAAVSVEQEKQANQDMSKSTYQGILVNKKRF